MSYIDEDFLAHHGILGMKWGVRRYQNKDGSLTILGRKRYGVNEARIDRSKAIKDLAYTRSHKMKVVKEKGVKYYNNKVDRLVDKTFDFSSRIKNTKMTAKVAKLEKKFNPKSKLQQKYYKEFMERGYTKREAKALAVRKQRVAIGIGIGLATTAIGIATYKKNEKMLRVMFDSAKKASKKELEFQLGIVKAKGKAAYKKYEDANKWFTETARMYQNTSGRVKPSEDVMRWANEVYGAREKSANDVLKYTKQTKQLYKNYANKRLGLTAAQNLAISLNKPKTQTLLGGIGAYAVATKQQRTESAVWESDKNKRDKIAARIAKDYKREHPDTKLSYNELLKKAKEGKI